MGEALSHLQTPIFTISCRWQNEVRYSAFRAEFDVLCSVGVIVLSALNQQHLTELICYDIGEVIVYTENVDFTV